MQYMKLKKNQKNGTPFNQRAIARKYNMNESTLRMYLRSYQEEAMVNATAKDMERRDIRQKLCDIEHYQRKAAALNDANEKWYRDFKGRHEEINQFETDQYNNEKWYKQFLRRHKEITVQVEEFQKLEN